VEDGFGVSRGKGLQYVTAVKLRKVTNTKDNWKVGFQKKELLAAFRQGRGYMLKGL